MKNKEFLFGIGCGEHFDNESDLKFVLDNLSDCVDFISIRFRAIDYPEDYLLKVGTAIANSGKTFATLYTYQFPPKSKEHHLTKENIKELKEKIGSLYFGDIFGESGSDRSAKAKGYYLDKPRCLAEEMPPQNYQDLEEAKNDYVSYVKKMADYDSSIGIDNHVIVEATALMKYDLEAGVRSIALETMPGDPEKLIAFTRGATKGYLRKEWYNWVADEWYGGYRHEDTLKALRFKLEYYFSYISGSSLAFLESGFNEMHSFGYNLFKDDKIPQRYRTTLKEIYDYINSDTRPGNCPIVKVGFVSGYLDGYTDFMGSSIWAQFFQEGWDKKAPEHSWRLLDSVYRKFSWKDTNNFACGKYDLSNSPAYGLYDVVPIESDISVLSTYDLLIFTGWNTMTKENLIKIKKYVENGGHIILTGAHLNENKKRTDEFVLNNKELAEELIGGKILGNSSTRDGIKFKRKSIVPKILYPGTRDGGCDCNHSNGEYQYFKIKPTSAYTVAYFDDEFHYNRYKKHDPIILENKIGNGFVTFVCSTTYPGDPTLMPLYTDVVKEHITATHRSCPIKVVANDDIRYAVYKMDDNKFKLYILNTNYNLMENVLVIANGKKHRIKIKPIQFETLIIDLSIEK